MSKHPKLYTKILDNGLYTVILHKPETPVACMNLAYKAGSKNELPGHTGLAHLFEHLMFEGSAHFGKGEFDRLCTLAGGINNAYTTYDMTSYNMSLPSFQLELGMWLESSRMSAFAVTDEAHKTQKSVVIEEINQTVYEQPYGLWREKLAEAAYAPNTPYSWEVHGSAEDVANSSISSLKEIFDNFYQPNNACLAIAGDAEPDSTFAMAEKYFGGIKNATLEKRPAHFPPGFQIGGANTEFIDNVPHSAVFIAFHCPGFTNDITFAAGILANILGSGHSSRLYNSLVYDKQAASMAGAFMDKREFGSLFTLFAIANDFSTTAEDLYKALMKEARDFKSKGPSEIELEKARNQATTQMANELLYSSGVADSLAQQALFWGEPERYFMLLDKYQAVTKQNLLDFANQYLKPENSVRVNAIPGAMA